MNKKNFAMVCAVFMVTMALVLTGCGGGNGSGSSKGNQSSVSLWVPDTVTASDGETLTVEDAAYEQIIYAEDRAFGLYHDDSNLFAVELTPAILEEFGTLTIDSDSITYTGKTSGKITTFKKQAAGKKSALDGIWAAADGSTAVFGSGTGAFVNEGYGFGFPSFEGTSGSTTIDGGRISFKLEGETVIISPAGYDDMVYTRGTWDAAVVEAAETAAVAAIKNPGNANPVSDFSYGLTADGKGIIITGYTGKPGKVVIPSKIEDMLVLELGRAVFLGKETWLADGRTEIYSNARITSITLPEALKVIGDMTFAHTAITAITIPDSVTTIGIGAFWDTPLKSIVLPDSVVEIKGGLFDECKKLTEIRLSDNIEILPPLFSFNGNSSLKKVNLPKNLKYLQQGTFMFCSELNELIIPDTLQSVVNVENYLGEWRPTDGLTGFAFAGCGKLPIKTRQRLQELGYTGGF